MLSSFHEATISMTDRTNQNDEPIVKPTAVMDYCKFMGGVDVHDQICQYYVLRR